MLHLSSELRKIDGTAVYLNRSSRFNQYQRSAQTGWIGFVLLGGLVFFPLTYKFKSLWWLSKTLLDSYISQPACLFYAWYCWNRCWWAKASYSEHLLASLVF